MKGFDPEFKDTADFSKKITERIWHERGVDRIRDYYADDVVFRTALGGLNRGNEAVVSNTLGVMHEFPDRRIYDEDFIWSENEPGVFYNSHRLLSKMTHAGDGMFGPATGTRITAYTLADVMYRENQAFNEYLVRDHAGIARQVGLDPEAMATDMARADRDAGSEVLGAADWIRLWSEGSEAGPPQGKAAIYAEALEGIWGRAALRLIREAYRDESVSIVPGPTALQGPEEQERFVIGYLASLSKPVFRLHHWVEQIDEGCPVRVALRWSLEAEHSGRGTFGAPSGARLAILAVSHAEFWGDRVMREWHGFDEIAIRRQIAAHRLAAGDRG